MSGFDSFFLDDITLSKDAGCSWTLWGGGKPYGQEKSEHSKCILIKDSMKQEVDVSPLTLQITPCLTAYSLCIKKNSKRPLCLTCNP